MFARTNAILITLAAGWVAPAAAQNAVTYNVSHQFSYAPTGDVVAVRSYQFEHVWAVNAGFTGEDHYPALQDPDFDPWGTESFTNVGFAQNTGLFATPVPVLYQVANIPSTGTGGPATHCTSVSITPTFAVACTSVEVDPFIAVPGSFIINGEIGSTGTANAAVYGRAAARAYAFSNTAITVIGGTQSASGQITWNPNFIIDAVGGGASDSVAQDPIHITAVNDVTGDTTEASLLHIDAEAGDNGYIEWNPAGLRIDAPRAVVQASIPATHVAPGQEGRLLIEVQGGVVTQSGGTGVFAGTAPPLGTAVPFTTPVPAITLDYDLGLNPNQPHSVRTILAGGGGTLSDFFNPCAADMNGDGIIDNGDIGLFITLFLEGHPAADVNSDGVIDNGDIGAFIEAFLAGCPDLPG
ncbi:MAG: GC-type dockerin domain-anchored protein [Phycisphaerales bacterium JB040]